MSLWPLADGLARPQGLIRVIKTSIYKEKPSPPDGRQIMFRDSIDLFIEAMDPGNDIFVETGEIPVVPECLEAVVFFSVSGKL